MHPTLRGDIKRKASSSNLDSVMDIIEQLSIDTGEDIETIKNVITAQFDLLYLSLHDHLYKDDVENIKSMRLMHIGTFKLNKKKYLKIKEGYTKNVYAKK